MGPPKIPAMIANIPALVFNKPIVSFSCPFIVTISIYTNEEIMSFATVTTMAFDIDVDSPE